MASRQRLSLLRLVNQAFCQSATPRLFRRVRATYPGIHLKNKGQHLARMLKISKSTHACYVCHVEVGIDSTWKTEPGYEEYLQDLSVLLPLCLSHFPNVTTLSVRGPIYSQGMVLDQPFPSYLSILLVKSVVNALSFVPFPKLRDLSLSFPITLDYVQLFKHQAVSWRVPMEDVLQQLQHLTVKICDKIGNERYEPPISFLQTGCQNAIYAPYMFKTIELAKNLTFLAIWAMNDLNIEKLDISNLNKLRALQLSGLSSSSGKLLSLIEPCKETLTRLELIQVELERGTWQNVLFRISQLATSLVFFQMQSNGYSKDGESAHLCPGVLPRVNDPRPIETCDVLDFHALGNVQRLVNSNRQAAGLPEMTKSDYMLLGITPLEDIIRIRSARQVTY